MTDTQLPDNCIYLEAIKNDGGARPPAGDFWVSPDILLNDTVLTAPSPPLGTTSGTARQAPGDNAIGVRVHLKTGCPVTAAGSPARAKVELYVCDPSMIVPASGVRVGNGQIDVATLTQAGMIEQFVNFVASSNASDPDGPGHKCMIARAYPRLLIPDPAAFHVLDDQHYAQRNICIQPCTMLKAQEGSMGGAGTGTGAGDLLLADSDGLLKFRLLTVNRRKRPAVAVIEAKANLRPPAHIVKAAAPVLRQLEIPAKPLTGAPHRIGIQVNKIAQLDSERIGQAKRRGATFWKGGILVPLRPTEEPAQKKRVTLQPRQQIAVTIAVDLRGLPTGRPLFVNATHQDNQGHSLGGCTLVFVLR